MSRRKKNRVLGCSPSIIDGSEHVFNAPESLSLPSKYDYREVMSKVLDQGSEPICLPCSLSTWVNWRINMTHGEKLDHNVNLREIFTACNGSQNGMTFKDALHYLRKHGVTTDSGVHCIQEYAMIKNIISLKNAIFLNGPCVAGLPVYDDSGYDCFWDSSRGSFKGGHAIAVIGWCDEGFIIRNSWGKHYADGGYAVLPYSDFSKIFEVWTIVR